MDAVAAGVVAEQETGRHLVDRDEAGNQPNSLRSQDSCRCRLFHLDEHFRHHPMSASYLNQSHQGFVTQKMGLLNLINPVSTNSKQRHQYNSESSSILKNKFLRKNREY